MKTAVLSLVVLLLSTTLFSQDANLYDLPLGIGDYAFDGHINKVYAEQKGDQKVIHSLMVGDFYVNKDKKNKKYSGKTEQVLGLGIYTFDRDGKLIDYAIKFINNKGYPDMEVASKYIPKSLSYDVISKEEDIISLKEAGFEGVVLTQIDRYFNDAESILLAIKNRNQQKLTAADLEPLPKNLYLSEANINMFSTFKGITTFYATLKPDAERIKIGNNYDTQLDIKRHYIVEKKPLNMDWFLKDEKWQKIKANSYVTDETNGKVVTAIGHIMKKGMQKYTILGFDKDGKILHEHVEEFSRNQQYPYVSVYQREKPIYHNRPKAIGYFFLPVEYPSNSFKMVLVDGAGKLIKRGQYEVPMTYDGLISSHYADDGSVYASFWHPEKTKMTIKNVHIKPNDEVSYDEIPMNAILGNEESVISNNKVFKVAKHFYRKDDNKLFVTLLNQTYEVKQAGSDLPTILCDGFSLVTHDNNGLVKDFYHAGYGINKIFKSKALFKVEEFVDVHGHKHYLIYRAQDDGKGSLAYQFNVIEVDNNGNIVNKPTENVMYTCAGGHPLQPLYNGKGYFTVFQKNKYTKTIVTQP